MTCFSTLHGEIIFLGALLDYQLTDAFCSPAEQRKAVGMIIDLDKGVNLNLNEASDKELKERTVSCGLAESADVKLTSWCTS